MKRILQYFITALLYGLVAIPVQAQFGSDLGANAVSTLAWQDISSSAEGGSWGETIGLTTDGRVYQWGSNRYYVINGNQSAQKLNVYQTAPYYKPMPEVITKVKIMYASNNQSAAASYPADIFTYFALGQSGKLYVWGVNTGLFGSTWPGASIPSDTDTTKVSRTPTPLTVPGESGIVDFTAKNGTLVVIGASGKAYVLGYYTFNQIATTFKTLPNPAGVGSSFKYTKLWGTLSTGFNLHLKGNDGNIYLTYSRTYSLSTGVPSLFNIGYTPGGGLPFGYGQFQDPTASTSNPVLVPFPAGEDIIHIEYDSNPEDVGSNRTYAISVSGKAYMTGKWRRNNGTNEWSSKVVLCPLKQEPAASDVYNRLNGSIDTTVYVKRFVEVAMPPGATGVLGIKTINVGAMSMSGALTMIVGNNHKVYWSGIAGNDNQVYVIGNVLDGANNSTIPYPNNDQCQYIYPITPSRYQWVAESINYRGAARIITEDYTSLANLFIISTSGRGYFVGLNALFRIGIGKVQNTYYPYPVPIANEQLLSCNTSPGTGGPLGEPVSTPAAGVIDCSKTKLYPAPVQGTPSELSLLVTINVTTIGDFSPITISGSGMSLVSGFDKVSATTTGVQTFHIPIKYDGSTLTNAFQFTIGQAGSCSADLTNKPSNEITKVWSLNNCTAITPGSLSK